MRHGLLIGITIIGLLVASVLISYADTTNYIYDELNRLIRVEYGDGAEIIYTYDQAGNRSHVYVGKYTLAVNVVGDGTVTKNPDQPIYSEGTSVTLTAVNGADTFSEWSGDLTGNTNPASIVMNGNKSVTATFVTPQNWLQGWTYRKAVALSRASGAVTNYQMRLLVGETAGASGENVDCNGHVRADFNDLRFTTSDGTTLLDYWIESITGTSPNRLATVWIEFDSIGTTATTFYMYYGKADATAYSNGPNTFIVFDDFERGADGNEVGGNWTEVEGIIEISTAQKVNGNRSMRLKGNGANYPRAKIAVTASNNIAIRFYQRKESGQTSWFQHGDGTNLTIISFSNDSKIFLHNGASWVDTSLTWTNDSWHLIEIRNFNWTTARADLHKDANAYLNGDISYAASDPRWNNAVLFTSNLTANYDIWIDCFIVRNYRATEPAWGSWGAEQAN